MKRVRHLFFLFLLLLTYVGYGQSIDSFFEKADAFLQANVKNGLVNYAAIKKNPDKLNELINMSSMMQVSKDNSKIYQAFYINGYNLHVIKGVVDSYPIKSPLEIEGFFDQIKRNIGGNAVTLNEIENVLLRSNFPDEPRFHFVLVCAGLGCPPIIDEVYLPENLDDQMQKQTKLALNDPNFIRVKDNKVFLSQIFEWYKEDFIGKDQDEIDFINRYRTQPIDNTLKIGYYPYDWTLNELK